MRMRTDRGTTEARLAATDSAIRDAWASTGAPRRTTAQYATPPAKETPRVELGQPSFFFIRSLINLGLAFPPLAFIVSPTRAPITFALPAR